jgi:hypothetical protein
MTDRAHILRTAASISRSEAMAWQGRPYGNEMTQQAAELDEAADHLERLTAAARAIVKTTTQALGGDWIITGNGEKLMAALREALDA